MYSWIKYSPLALRSSEERCSIRGPQISMAKRRSFSYEGSKLSFLWPRDSWFMPSDTYHYFDRSYTSSDLRTNYDRFNDNWKFSQPVRSHWRFDGPWFTGRLAHISASIFLLSPAKPKGESSFFHPQAFEFAISQLLSDFREGSLHKGSEQYVAPYNWSVVNGTGCPAVKFEDVWAFQSDPVINYCHVVSQNTLAMFSFSITTPERSRWVNGGDEQCVDREPIFSLINSIIDSVRVELSDSSKALLSEVEAKAPDARLSQSFPPIKWDEGGFEEPELLQSVGR